MSGKLQAVSNATLGFLGLNTQESGVTLESGYATKATNCIIDKSGRLGSRRGWTGVSAANTDLGSTNYIESIFEFKEIGGTVQYLSAGNRKLFTGTSTLTQKLVYGADSGGPVPLSTQPTFTGNRWQFASLQENSGTAAESYAFAAQRGNKMMVYREGAHSGPFVFQQIGTYGTIPTGVTTFDPDCVHSAFGRIWTGGLTENRTTVFFSRLLDGATFTGTGSGLLDVGAFLNGNDYITAISSHNGYLIVFCSNNILIYAGAENPLGDTTSTAGLTLKDTITGVGCIARDSVQQTGTDLIFLSNSGVRSLNRVIQDKSMPMRDLSSNIRDDLVSYVDGEDLTQIKSVYYERDAFYLLVLPGLKQTYYFDLRQSLPSGAARTTVWDNFVPKALCSTVDRKLYLGFAGQIGYYFGYTDNGSSYRLEYFTTNTDVGSPFTLKFLKSTKVVVIASGSQDIVIKYGFDYQTSYSAVAYTKDFSGVPSEFNIAEYGVNGKNKPGSTSPSEYSGGVSIYELPMNLGGSGKILQFGIECTVDGAAVSLQQMSVYLKLGKMI